MKKRICHILFYESANPVHAHKDSGMILYNLAKNHGWTSTYVGFSLTRNTGDWSAEFKKYVDVNILGLECDIDEQIRRAKKFLREHIDEFDVIMFATYGSVPWKLSRYCKKLNPNIKVYCKLDMNSGGFRHFNIGRNWFWLRDSWESFKSRGIDFFTVETWEYFNNIKESKTFGGKIEYLPNGVSLLDLKNTNVDFTQKQNIVVTVGRLGVYAKNTELLVDSLLHIPEDLRNKWKFYFVGPQTPKFSDYLNLFLEKYPTMNQCVEILGNIDDRDYLMDILKRSKIICMTSRSESTCIATLEGMYFGNYPVITNYSSFVKDTTDNMIKGDVIFKDTPEEMAKGLTQRMKDTELSDRGLESMKYVREKFSYDNIVSNLNRYLSELIK